MTQAVRTTRLATVYNLDESRNLSMLYIRHLVHQLGLIPEEVGAQLQHQRLLSQKDR